MPQAIDPPKHVHVCPPARLCVHYALQAIAMLNMQCCWAVAVLLHLSTLTQLQPRLAVAVVQAAQVHAWASCLAATTTMITCMAAAMAATLSKRCCRRMRTWQTCRRTWMATLKG